MKECVKECVALNGARDSHRTRIEFAFRGGKSRQGRHSIAARSPFFLS